MRAARSAPRPLGLLVSKGEVGNAVPKLAPPTALPPPAAMAAALKTAAAFLLSRIWWRRSTTASSNPSIRYGRASWRRLQRICGEQRGEEIGGSADV